MRYRLYFHIANKSRYSYVDASQFPPFYDKKVSIQNIQVSTT